MSIELTNIIIQTVPEDQAPLLGFCRVTLNSQFVVNGIRIVQGSSGIFISFPREYNKKTGHKNGICFPINRGLGMRMTEQIVSAYKNEIGEPEEEKPIPQNIIRQEY